MHTIFIGGGINSLIGAALLAKAGKKVLVLESSDYLGGCIRSEKVDGCIIDTMSTAYPLFVTSPSYAALKKDLEQQGLEFVYNNTPTGSVLSNKTFTIIKTNRQDNIKAFNTLAPGDGDVYHQQMEFVGQHAPLLFTMLGQELFTKQTAWFLAKYVYKTGIHQSLKNVQSFLPSLRQDLPSCFQSKELLASLAPWVLHTGLSVESPFSSTMAKIIAMTVEMVGLPLVKGGSYKIVDALKKIIEQYGGQCLMQQHVVEIILNTHQKATGVKCKDGTVWNAKFIVANTTPNQLYQKLLPQKSVPQDTQMQVKKYQYGKGNMQIHLILNEKPKWFNTELDNVVYVHLTDGIDDVSQAVNEATRQQLPQKATICIAQQSAVDTTRAPQGKYVLWIQLPECPNYPVADAANQLNHLCKGEWTTALSDAYADRILKRVEQYISNIQTACIYKQIISPKELSQLNINLEHGDPYGGSCELNQYLLWRPVSTQKNHNTPVKNVFHIGASTHPGPGLGGVSGFHIAQQLIKK